MDARGGPFPQAGAPQDVANRPLHVRKVECDAAVVEVGAPNAEQVNPVTDEDLLDQLFELEKRLAFDIYAELGIQLTQAERERLRSVWTTTVVSQEDKALCENVQRGMAQRGFRHG